MPELIGPTWRSMDTRREPGRASDCEHKSLIYEDFCKLAERVETDFDPEVIELERLSVSPSRPISGTVSGYAVLSAAFVSLHQTLPPKTTPSLP